ncbi:MAG: hypothetical protein JOZ83_15255 [Silvibacterium sp.]|nr:hypothetical protein [Silvibacterium sp.]
MAGRIRILHAPAIARLLVFASMCAGAQEGHNPESVVSTPETFALSDTKDVTTVGAKAEAVEYKGRKAVRLTKPEGDEAGLAFLNGTQFRDGTIEVDVATKVIAPPGVRRPGFTGIAFRSSDPAHYELFYLRPGNSKAEDQAMRNHSVQYVSEPGFGWEKLRRQWPFIYESWADLQQEEWTNVKIEVRGRHATLYLNGSPNPSLVVDGLKGDALQGAVALWSYSGEESYFSNLRITPAKAEPLENGGEAAGTWEVQCATDAGGFGATLKLVRQDSTLIGIWSGGLGPDQAVGGVWRDGYVELSFGGTWPEQPGTVSVTLDGWIDGGSAKGRVKVEGRAMGRWTAVRQK